MLKLWKGVALTHTLSLVGYSVLVTGVGGGVSNKNEGDVGPKLFQGLYLEACKR